MYYRVTKDLPFIKAGEKVKVIKQVIAGSPFLSFLDTTYEFRIISEKDSYLWEFSWGEPLASGFFEEVKDEVKEQDQTKTCCDSTPISCYTLRVVCSNCSAISQAHVPKGKRFTIWRSDISCTSCSVKGSLMSAVETIENQEIFTHHYQKNKENPHLKCNP